MLGKRPTIKLSYLFLALLLLVAFVYHRPRKQSLRANRTPPEYIQCSKGSVEPKLARYRVLCVR